ncbi:hypothetical protein KP509_05G006000 [Ceratopteris richardii]|nr:hypothetical protein KP509_05G006000 [Ceratopteris richardii]
MDAPLLTLIREQLGIFHDCHGLIVNSFDELEEEVCKALQDIIPIPVSVVGPLVPSRCLEAGKEKVGPCLSSDKSECMLWLDKQAEQSVLYISFGSILTPPPGELESIANGIKDSQRPFLWVLRPTSTSSLAEILPKSFLEDTAQQGLIISWAPQVQVLSHPAVGAFLTHCGWNSTLEGISSGIPLILYPMFSDQTTNCAYASDFWKIGVSLRTNVQWKVDRSDVTRVLKHAFEEGESLRKRTAKLKEAARRALQAQGSSSIHMDNFIQGLRRTQKI